MNWYLFLYIAGLVFPLLFYVIDLYDNNFDAHFSEKTLKKLSVKENSIFKKIIPFKEGSIKKNGVVVRYRYLLYPRVYAFLIQSFILLIGLIVLLINFLVIEFMNDRCFMIVGMTSLGIWLVYTLMIGILSQGLHL